MDLVSFDHYPFTAVLIYNYKYVNYSNLDKGLTGRILLCIRVPTLRMSNAHAHVNTFAFSKNGTARL